jgi:hypothetical protein
VRIGVYTFMIPILPLMVYSMSSYCGWDAMIVEVCALLCCFAEIRKYKRRENEAVGW